MASSTNSFIGMTYLMDFWCAIEGCLVGHNNSSWSLPQASTAHSLYAHPSTLGPLCLPFFCTPRGIKGRVAVIAGAAVTVFALLPPLFLFLL